MAITVEPINSKEAIYKVSIDPETLALIPEGESFEYKIKLPQHNYYSSNVLPSQYQIGDSVSLEFYQSGLIRNAEIFKVHFTDSKVLYDVFIPLSTDINGKVDYTRLYNIDSVCVIPQI